MPSSTTTCSSLSPLELRFWVLVNCNGMICLSHGLDDIAICNPSTRKCRQLPRAKIDYFELGHVSYGFGSDAITDDYNKKFIWYDLEHNTVKNIEIRGLPDSFERVMGVESLIQLKGGDGLNRDGEGKNRRKDQKKNLKKRLMLPESSTFAQEKKMQSFENQMGRVPEDTDDGLRIIW